MEWNGAYMFGEQFLDPVQQVANRTLQHICHGTVIRRRFGGLRGGLAIVHYAVGDRCQLLKTSVRTTERCFFGSAAKII